MPFVVFALFLGVAMSVTAFPVLARILSDRGIQKTRLGVIAISCAAVDDVTAWCLLAFVVSVAQTRAVGALTTIGTALAYVAVMLLIVRPWIERKVRAQELLRKTSGGPAFAFIGLLLSALFTESIGIHALFGAFLLGALIPHESLLAKELTAQARGPRRDRAAARILRVHGHAHADRPALDRVRMAGARPDRRGRLRRQVRRQRDRSQLAGLGWRDAAALGVLMNTRGLMELIVLNVGLDLRVISPTLFAMMVLMALVTTLLTTPVLHLLTKGQLEVDGASAPEALG